MYQGQHNYWRRTVFRRRNKFMNFSPGLVILKPVSFVRHFVPERFTACPGTDFALFF